MEQYISKAALVAEIEGRLSLLEGSTGHPEVVKRVEGVIKAYKSILSFLDTLEVKEVDLENETQKILDKHFFYPEEDDELKETPKLARYIAKHFFQLGLNTQKGD